VVVVVVVVVVVATAAAAAVVVEVVVIVVVVHGARISCKSKTLSALIASKPLGIPNGMKGLFNRAATNQ